MVTCRALVVGISVVLGASSCGDSTAPQRCNPTLAGTWNLQGAIGTVDPTIGMLRNVSMTLTVDQRVAASLGCEHVTGTFTSNASDGRVYAGSVLHTSMAPPDVDLAFEYAEGGKGGRSFYVRFVGTFDGTDQLKGNWTQSDYVTLGPVAFVRATS